MCAYYALYNTKVNCASGKLRASSMWVNCFLCFVTVFSYVCLSICLSVYIYKQTVQAQTFRKYFFLASETVDNIPGGPNVKLFCKCAVDVEGPQLVSKSSAVEAPSHGVSTSLM